MQSTEPARPSPRGRRRPAAGFSLIELLVVVLVIGIITAIAVPNVKRALTKSRRTAAYKSAVHLSHGIEKYMLDHDTVPPTLNTRTLEPVVSETDMTEHEAQSIVNTFEGEELLFYWGGMWGPWWGGYGYYFVFQPRGEPNSWCYFYMDQIWCWLEEEQQWVQVHGS